MRASRGASTNRWAKSPNRATAAIRAIRCTCSTRSSHRWILLLDLEGLPREQIADVLGLTPNAVAVRMTRLRQAFEKRYLEE